METFGCIALFAIGSMVRDGYPTLHSTHAARALGALVCAAGAYLAMPHLAALLVGLGVWVGFYFDMKHGEGQGPDGSVKELLNNLPYLLLSGITSVIPPTLFLVILADRHFWPLVFVGLIKPLIWPLAWNILPRSGLMRHCLIGNPPESFFVPTRISAMSFGACIGMGVSLFV